MSLEVTDLTFSYGDLQVLEGLSFRVNPGEIAAFVGPSGCGKSTLLRCLAGLLQSFSGQVRFRSEGQTSTNGQSSFVFQRPTLLPWLTVRENLALPFEMAGREVPSDTLATQLNGLGLLGFEDSFPSQLSLGMAQRVAFARALSEDRPLLLLDEPYSALDEITRQTLAVFLSEQVKARGLVGVFVTHALHDATFLGDRVFVLSERPARIRKEIRVPIEGPRTKALWLASDLLPYMDQARRALEGQEDRPCEES